MSLAEKVALVTGGTRGLGRAIAHRLARDGARVVLCGRDAAAAQAAAEEIAGDLPGSQLYGVGADLTDPDQAQALVKAAEERFGRVDVLVNNAGITRDTLLLRMSEQDWSEVIAADLSSVFRVTKGCLRGMLKRRWGRIINISSVSGLMGNPGQSNYAAAKAGILGFTRSLAREVAERGITVNAVAPGYIEVGMTSALTEAQRQAILSQVPAGRTGRAEEVAAAVAFLASEEAAYITGHTLVVDGGMSTY